MIKDIPTACDRGTKCNAQGYKLSWNGYKLHLDTADCGVPIAAILSSASMHDSLAAIPLSLISAGRVTNLYDLMDAAYCSAELREHSRNPGHVPLINHNPRRGTKIEFSPPKPFTTPRRKSPWGTTSAPPPSALMDGSRTSSAATPSWSRVKPR